MQFSGQPILLLNGASQWLGRLGLKLLSCLANDSRAYSWGVLPALGRKLSSLEGQAGLVTKTARTGFQHVADFVK